MNILKKIPKKIENKPYISINKEGERFAIIDYEIYKILNNNIKDNDLLNVWYNSKKRNNDNSSIKNIIIKDSKINKLKIINHTDLYCDCSNFKNNNNCRHIEKLKKFFKMEKDNF